MKAYLRGAAGVLLGVFLLTIAISNLDSAPPAWWDEGWTMSVARNWVVDGHYGRSLLGKPAPPGLEATFPVTASVALSFRLLGVGLLQARIPSVIFTLATLALVYYLARHLYNRPVAVTALLVLLFTPFHPDLHPVLAGRQVLGEMPALFFLLTGYAIFLSAHNRPFMAMPLVVCFWGTALITKLQVFPFWLASLLVPLALAVSTRHWKTVLLLVVGLSASLLSARVFIWLQQLLLERTTDPLAPIPGLYYVTALVSAPSARAFAFVLAVSFGLPTVAGLCYGLWRLIKDKKQCLASNQTDIVRLSLLVLVTTWFAWFLILSAGWPRYLFPITLVASIFVAAMLIGLTTHLHLLPRHHKLASNTGTSWLNKRSITGGLVMILVMVSVSLTLRMLYRSYVKDADSSLLRVIHFLNTQTPFDSLVETYDPELFFLLERPYHYPPDPLHVDLIRRFFFGEVVSIDYDPLERDPDYLVVGQRSNMWPLYDPVLSTGAFRLLKTFNRYDVYERVP